MWVNMWFIWQRSKNKLVGIKKNSVGEILFYWPQQVHLSVVILLDIYNFTFKSIFRVQETP